MGPEARRLVLTCFAGFASRSALPPHDQQLDPLRRWSSLPRVSFIGTATAALPRSPLPPPRFAPASPPLRPASQQPPSMALLRRIGLASAQAPWIHLAALDPRRTSLPTSTRTPRTTLRTACLASPPRPRPQGPPPRMITWHFWVGCLAGALLLPAVAFAWIFWHSLPSIREAFTEGRTRRLRARAEREMSRRIADQDEARAVSPAAKAAADAARARARIRSQWNLDSRNN